MDSRETKLEAEVMQWKPIETAPRDGRRVKLGWLPNDRLELERQSRWVRYTDKGETGGHWSGWWTPTHWKAM